MNASQIAARLTAEQADGLRSHALWRGCQPATWPETLLDPSCTTAAWTALAEEAALALELIVIAFGAIPFTEEQLLQAARPGIAGAELRLGLYLLGETGIVFAVRRGWGEKLFVLPQDSLLPWYEAIRTSMRSGLNVQHPTVQFPKAQLPDVLHQGQTLQEVDPYGIDAVDGEGYVPPFSLQLLHAMAHMADAGLKLTAKRVLTKKTIAKGAGQLFIEDAALTALITPSPVSLGSNETDTAAYPPALLFVLETAIASGWLREHDGCLERDDSAWHAWLNASPDDREGTLLRQLLAAACARNAAAAAGAATMCSLAAGAWHRVDEIEAYCKGSQRLLAKPYLSMIGDWCRLFSQMGWIEQGSDSNGAAVIKWRIAPIPYCRLPNRLDESDRSDESEACDSQWSGWSGVQLTPDGDLYVDDQCSYAVRWQLELIAERRRTDITTVYRIRPDSCKRAAAAGFTRESLVAYLEELTQERLPDTVRAMIILGMEGSGAARNGERGNRTMAVSSHPTQEKAYFGHSEDAMYELLQERMTPKQLFAGIDDIPSMWLKQFRAYHLSTRRDLLEQALRWRTTVKLNCAGSITHFIPERIIDEGSGWAVSGYSQQQQHEQLAPMKLYPAMWEEMMLLLPTPFGE